MKNIHRSLAVLAVSTSFVAASAIAQTQQQQPQTQPQTQAQQNQQMQGQQAGSQAQQSQQNAVAASSLTNQPIYNPQGQPLGRIAGVVVDPNGQHFLVISMNDNYGGQDSAVPASNVIRQNDNFYLMQMSDADLRNLPAYRDGQNGMETTQANTRVALGSLQQQGQQQTQQQAQQGQGSNIVVQQRPPAITVDPVVPQVTVQQPTPQVDVTQPQPEIIVRQAPPTITVDMPQPEVIVRMPEPDVNVSMAQPQVQVRVPEPQVRVAESPEPQVQFSPADQAQVSVQQPQKEAQVNVQRAQPQIRIERTGEPRVVFNQAQGEPRVRFEQMTGQPNQQRTENTTVGQGNLDANDLQTQQNVAGSTGSANQTGSSPVIADTESTASINPPSTDQQTDFVTPDTTQAGRALPVAASDLRGMEVYNRRGNSLGEVQQVLIDRNDQPHLVVEYGGFLGIGEQQVVLPIDRFAMQGEDRLVIPRHDGRRASCPAGMEPEHGRIYSSRE